MMESEIKAYEDNVVKEPLIAEGAVLKGSPVKKTKTDAAYGTTEWTLKNGIKVVVKPTKFRADEGMFAASAKGGASVLTDGSDVISMYGLITDNPVDVVEDNANVKFGARFKTTGDLNTNFSVVA